VLQLIAPRRAGATVKSGRGPPILDQTLPRTRMKGIVFTEFIEMVESRYSPELVDRIIQAAHLPSGGAYTSVGTYDHAEMWSLVVELSKVTETPMPDLMKAFGEHLLGRFVVAHAAMFAGHQGSFDFLASVDSIIHREVRKLYPDAELPHFEVAERSPQRMVLLYQSPRHFGDLAEGLIRGCARHYGEELRIGREDLPVMAGSRVRFTLERA
jgi:hypothetical protein